jgi:putative tricarboxylic transport membrane protein
MDLIILYVMGGLGYIMRKFDFPTAPVIIGMILGPMCEQAFRQALTISNGSLMTFVERPISGTILALTLLLLLAPLAWKRFGPKLA